MDQEVIRGQVALRETGLTGIPIFNVENACASGGSAFHLAGMEELGLCGPGEGRALLASGATRLGGALPVNPSGGLLSKGHPVGASGCAQIVELTEQLKWRAGDRQVQGAVVGLVENAGGYLGPDHAAASVTVLSR